MIKGKLNNIMTFNFEEWVNSFLEKNKELIKPFIMTLVISLVAYGTRLTLLSFSQDDILLTHAFNSYRWLNAQAKPLAYLPMRYLLLNFAPHFLIIFITIVLRVIASFIIFKSIFKNNISNFALIIVSSIFTTFVYNAAISFYMPLSFMASINILLLVMAVTMVGKSISKNIFATVFIMYSLAVYQPSVAYYILFSLMLFLNYFLNHCGKISFKQIIFSIETKLLVKRALIAIVGATVYFIFIKICYIDTNQMDYGSHKNLFFSK